MILDFIFNSRILGYFFYIAFWWKVLNFTYFYSKFNNFWKVDINLNNKTLPILIHADYNGGDHCKKVRFL